MYIKSHIQNQLSALSMAAIIALALFSSCSSDDPETSEPQEIGFRIPTNASRASVPLSTDYNMWVTALYHKDNNGLYSFADYPFVYNTTNSLWQGETPVYYPLSGKMDFVAYATMNANHKPSVTYNPKKTKKGIGDGERMNPIIMGFTIMDTDTKPGNRLDGTDDVLVSAVTEDITCGRNAPADVPINFVHLLSNVRIAFSAETRETQEIVQITGVELENVHLYGTATLEPETDKPWKISWDFIDPPTSLRRNLSISPRYDKALDLPYTDFFLPGQNTRPTDGPKSKFRIYYRYSIGNGEYSPEMCSYGILFDSKEPTLQAGKRYTYNIVILMLPHLEFRVELKDVEGYVLDNWVNEDDINL